VRRGIVEGEPGIFPDPIARLLRRLGALFQRQRQRQRPEDEGKRARQERGREQNAEDGSGLAADRRPCRSRKNRLLISAILPW